MEEWQKEIAKKVLDVLTQKGYPDAVVSVLPKTFGDKVELIEFGLGKPDQTFRFEHERLSGYYLAYQVGS